MFCACSAFISSHYGQVLLEFCHTICIYHKLWETIINVSHCEYRPEMHGQLAMDLMQMPVQLFVVSIITDELPSFCGKRQKFREHRVANAKDPLVEQA